jgi:hypothetical protein
MWHVWGRREEHKGLWSENLRERDNLEDLGLDGRQILKWILRKWDGGMDWIDLAQDMKLWWALVNVIMNNWVP